MKEILSCCSIQRLLCMAILLGTISISYGADKKIFCYYSSFAQTRQGVGKFVPEDIDPFMCTHIIFAFVDISADGRDLRPFNRNDQGPRGLYTRTLALKQKNPDLKVLLAVGGWQIGSKPFIPMISSESNRRAWVKNVVTYLRTHGFDGFDLDWEFPATRGSPPDDKYRYTKLMKELYEAFAREARETGNDKLLLTMATASGTYYIDQSYEPKQIIKYLDYMLLMTYNYHGQWEKITGHHSGLNRHNDDPKWGEKSQLYTQWSIDYWLDAGIDPSRLVVGIATYGMSFTLQNAHDNGVHAPASGGGQMGDYTRETGIIAYYEVCLNLNNNGWNKEWINEQAVPYAYSGDQWVGYEDKDSVAIKAENILSRGLAGAFVWSVEMDDFNNVCDGGNYPLIRTIHRILGDNVRPRPAARLPERIEDEDTKINVRSLGKLNKRKQRRGKLRRRPSRRTTVNTPSTVTTTTQPPMQWRTTSSVPDTTTSDKHRLLVRWWSGSVWQKGATRRPIRRTTQGRRLKRPLNYWRKKARKQRRLKSKKTRKQPKNRNSVVSWETTPWWQSSSVGANNKVTVRWNARATGKPGFGLQKDPTTRPPVTSRQGRWNRTPRHEVTTRSVPLANPAAAGDCQNLGVGTFAHPTACEQFIICMPGVWLDYPPHLMTCPAGTKFDKKMKICNYASQVIC